MTQTAAGFDLLADYADGRRMLGWTLVALAATALGFALLDRTGWLALSMRLWLAYSCGHLALWAYRRWSPEVDWRIALACAAAACAVGSVAGLPLAGDFVVDRLKSPSWWLQRGALPLGFGLAMHAPAFMLRLREWTKHRQRIAAAEAAAAKSALLRQVTIAQLKTLQAQVEPHFLYNTLASVQHLVRQDPARADEMLDHLHEHLRQSLPAMRSEHSTLGREMQLARSYLSIMRIRLADRLRFEINLPDELAAAPFPPMMLSTLVENAVQHGIEPSSRGGTVSIDAALQPEGIAVTVLDDGVGLGGAGASTSGSGIGLANLRERLQALFGGKGSLAVESRPGGGVMSRIVIPG